MVKQKSLNNKGFSLVELIVVIAIMAILVGVLAPNFLRYLDEGRRSRDTQLGNTVRTAVTTAVMDPDISTTVPAKYSFATATGYTILNSGDIALEVARTLGYADAAALADATTGVDSRLVGNNHNQILVDIDANFNVTVTVDYNAPAEDIVLGNNASPSPAST